jgi:hypothetical protein
MLGVAGDGMLTYYAQVWALTHFLREGDGGRHRDPLRTLLLHASQGQMRQTMVNRVGDAQAAAALRERRGATVFRAYFGDDFSATSAAYDAFIARLVEPGSRGPIAEGKSPFAPAR